MTLGKFSVWMGTQFSGRGKCKSCCDSKTGIDCCVVKKLPTIFGLKVNSKRIKIPLNQKIRLNFIILPKTGLKRDPQAKPKWKTKFSGNKWKALKQTTLILFHPKNKSG